MADADKRAGEKPSAGSVSVIVPTRNRADVIPRALESALAQEEVALEVIVIDDGSTDRTPELIRDWSRGDPRLHMVRNQESLGAAAARNRAVEQATGEFLAFLDDDDEWLPGKLRSQVDMARRGPAGVVYCRFMEIDADGGERQGARIEFDVTSARPALVRGNLIGLSTVLVRRSSFDKVGGFDVRLPRLQDWDLWIRLAGAERFAFMDTPCVRVHLLEESISTDHAALARAADLLAEKYRVELPLPRGEHADLLLSLARLLARAGHAGGARRLARRAVLRDPRSLIRTAESLLIALDPAVYAGARRAARGLLPHWKPSAGRIR